MSEPYSLSESDEADLAALADDRLDPARRQRLEARAAEEPALARAIERQRAGREVITRVAGDVSAPLALRARIEREAAEPSGHRPRRRLRFGMRIPALGLAAAAVATLLLVVLVSAGGPATADVLAAAARPAVAAVQRDPAQPRLLRDHVDDVRFPDYAAKFGWKPVGTRTDEIGGRPTRTVFYRRGTQRIAYTIVAGKALKWPDAPSRVYDGVTLRVFSGENRTAVTWRRHGRTCVLSSPDVPASTLAELAAWKGQGAVTF